MRVALPGGQVAEFPDTMPQADVEKAVRAHLGVKEPEVPRGEGDKVMAPSTPEGIAGRVLSAGAPDPKNEPVSALGVTPQMVGNAVLPPLVTAPLVAAGGELLPAAPAIGRALASGGISAATTKSDPLWAAFIGALVGGAGEAGTALLSRLKIPFTDLPTLKTMGEKIPGARAGFERGGERIREAFDAVKDRLPPGKWMSVPTLGKGKVTAEQAVDGLLRQRGKDYEQTLGEIVSEFNRLDIQHGVRGFRGPAPYAGAAFKTRAPAERFEYAGTQGERAATRFLDISRSPATRAVLQSELTPEIAPGIPRGAVPLMGGEGFSALARHARPRLKE